LAALAKSISTMLVLVHRSINIMSQIPVYKVICYTAILAPLIQL